MVTIKNQLMKETLRRYLKTYMFGMGMFAGFQEMARFKQFDELLLKLGITLDGFFVLYKEGEGTTPFPMPLLNVTYFQYAISHEALEYRSIGAEFLAQQKGGHLGIRIDMVIPDPIGTLAAILMEKMVALSKPRREFDKNTTFEVAEPTDPNAIDKYRGEATAAEYKLTRSGLPNIYQRLGRKYNLKNFVFYDSIVDYFIKASAQLDESNGDIGFKSTVDVDIGTLRNVWRRTGVLVMRERTMFDVYIETMRYGRRNIDGINYSTISILFREFRPDDVRVEKIIYGRMPRRQPLAGRDLECDYGDEPVIAVKYKDYKQDRKLAKKTTEFVADYVKKHIMAMMGLSKNYDSRIQLDTTNTIIIDVYEFLTELLNIGNIVYSFTNGTDYMLNEYRVGGRVLRKW